MDDKRARVLTCWGHVYFYACTRMPPVKVRFIFANYDRVETTGEYETSDTKVDALRAALFAKIQDKTIQFPDNADVQDVSQLRMFEAGKMLVDGKTLEQSNFTITSEHPTVITVSVRPINAGVAGSGGSSADSGCCIIT